MNTELMYLVWITAFTATDVDTVHPGSHRRVGTCRHRRLPGQPEAAIAVGAAHEGGARQRRREPGHLCRAGAGRACRRHQQRRDVFACALYFWARIVHWFAYTAALPWARTLAFAGGFIAQMILAWQLIMR